MSYAPSQTRSIRPVSLVKRSDKLGPRGPVAARLGASFQQDTAGKVQLLKYLQYAILAGFILLIALLANFSTTNYRLFATTAEGKLTAPPPLDQELGDNIVNLWLVDAMSKIMTMGFHDYKLRLLEIRPLFNDRGWDSFVRFQRTAVDGQPNIRASLENSYLLMGGRPNSPPQIVEKSLISGVYTYKMQIEMMINTYGAPYESVRRQVFEIVVERVKPEVNPNGIAIAQWRLLRTG